MDKRTELITIINEEREKASAQEKADAEVKWATQEEHNVKILEENKELKAQLESMQGRIITINQKTGVNRFVFSGFDPELSKNFKATLNSEESEQVAKIMVAQAKARQNGDIFNEVALKAAFDGSNAIPVQYGSALMGLAELSSRALQYARVMVIESSSMKLPAKGTRETVDAQASGTANTEGSTTIGQLTWTIDKRVGGYIELLNDQLDDMNIDIVNQWVIPAQAEAIGQNMDGEMFNGTEFTSSVSGVTTSVSGDSTATGSLTFAKLNTMFYAIEWERLGALSDPKWFGSRAALKDISALVDDNGRPIFQQVPINGRPSQTLMGSEYVITPVIANEPADGAIRLAFGDPNHYLIAVRGGTFVSMVNPFIKMKEDVTQFICKARCDGNVSDHATVTSSGAWTTMQRND